MVFGDFGFFFWWAPGILLFGVVAFVMVALLTVLRVLGEGLRAIFGLGGRGSGAADARWGQRKCNQLRCGHVNTPRARFCARCGAALSGAREFDAYG